MDCLVTKLKGSVNDHNLLKLGELRLTKSKAVGDWNGASQNFMLKANENMVISIIGDGYFTDKDGISNKGTSLNLKDLNNGEFFVSNGDMQISIPNKYALTDVVFSNNVDSYELVTEGQLTKDVLGGCENLRYCKNLTTLSKSKGYVGDLSFIAQLTNLRSLYLLHAQLTGDTVLFKGLNGLTTLAITNTDLTGDISNFAGLGNLKSLGLQFTKVTGDIASLQNLSNLVTLNVANTSVGGDIGSIKSPLTTMIVASCNVKGKIEDFVKAQRDAGRTTGSCSNGGNSWGTKITFKDNVIETGADTLSWTADKITCKDEQITA